MASGAFLLMAAMIRSASVGIATVLLSAHYTLRKQLRFICQAGGRVVIPKNAFGCRNPAVFRVRFFRISSSRKQLWIGHVFLRFGTSGFQEWFEAEEFAAEGAGGYATQSRFSFLRFLAQSRR